MEINTLTLLYRYKEIIYEEVEYDEPKVILERISNLTNKKNELLLNLAKKL